MTGYIANDDFMNEDEQAAIWCLRLAEDSLSDEERQTFDNWYAEPLNARAFREALVIWQSADEAAERPELIHIRSQALQSLRHANSRRWARGILDHWRWPAGLVAAMLIAILTGVMLFYTPTQIYETGTGERQVIALEDGSKLSLDALTSVEARMTDDGRELRLLTGRAKFDVAKDSLRPFSVAAGNKIVVATGTSFSVELLSEQARVVLYEGSVEILDQVDGTAKARPIAINKTRLQSDNILVPGSELVAPLSSSTADIAPIDVERSLSWEAGQISFDNERLSSAVERINRYSDQTLIVGDQSAANIRLNGVFTAGDTEAFVEAVTALHDVKAVRETGRLTLKSGKTAK
ncbi:FecR family protein [Parasphingorhabdus cellanae]|uniref:FecR domain-containing protein n=1 Tax=Parasphingorhabdus cellanae TaxID=2806553 RepID=A0ABX7TAG4_9SPHN|nr:FecR domain-containing protein [Parasphingorhabdus cellanae]QTD57465.1 FecR domain-containing protein [Parasphingorhabdus cellanae]